MAKKSTSSTAKSTVTKPKIQAKTPTKKSTAKPAAKKPAAKPSTKVTAKKPAAKPAAKKPVAKKPAAKPVAAKVALKKPAAKVALKKPAAKPAAKSAAKPTTQAVSKPSATKAPTKKQATTQPTAKKSGNAPVDIRASVKTSSGIITATKPSPRPIRNALDLRELNFTPYDIRHGEDYMNAQQLQHFKSILQGWKQALMEQVDQTVNHLQDEPGNLADPSDRATQEEEFNLELRTRDRERKLITKIDIALNQIKQSDYGFCSQCGEEIGIRRLEARPTATLCIDCKTLSEIREKHFSS